MNGFTLFLRLALAALATYRIAQLFTLDTGPFRVFLSLRLYLGKKAARMEGKEPWFSLAELTHCPYCLGVWLALPLGLLAGWPSLYGDIFLVWFGLAGAQAFLQSIFDDRGE